MEQSGEEAFALLTANLPLVKRAVAFACRRYGLDPDDAEEFAAIVNLKLVENDGAILRAYEARSAFATFISVVVQRMALDYRIHAWGKWHTTVAAKRLGPLAVELERLLHRDGRSFDEAFVILGAKHDVTRESLAGLAERLPRRTARPREVAIGERDMPAPEFAADDRVEAGERRRTSERLSALMATIIGRMPEDEQLILQLRFEGGMAVSQIARVLQLDQKALYRRIERRMRDMRKELEDAGVVPNDVLDLIGREESVLHFDMGNRNWRPSIGADETASTQSEESS